MKTRNNQKGFSIVEILLVIVFVGLIGLAGWYVLHSKQSANSNYNNASNSQSAATKNSENKSTTPTEVVKTFYNEYNNSSGYSNDYLALVKMYGTDNLVKYFNDNQKGTDPIVCAQMTPPKQTVEISSSSPDVTIIKVIQSWDGGERTIKVTVLNKTLKIDGIQCPTPLPTQSP